MNYIELKHVNKEIKQQSILHDISLSLPQDGVYGFSGSNGSGKSMLFRIIAGLVLPSSGEVFIAGKNLHQPKRSFPESIGIMIDSIGLFPYFTGMENLTYLASIKNKLDEKDLRDVMMRVGLDPDNQNAYAKYSLGMKQRLILAQAIMESPELLIFDEPTNSLDKDGRELFRTIVREEQKRGATILISSHIPNDLENLCQRIFYMDNGYIEELKS